MKKTVLCILLGAVISVANVSAEETVIPRFDLKQILVEGNTILSPYEISSILKKYTGQQKDFGTLQEAMESLETAYRRRGYSMVTVILPEQELERGTVVINVMEPRVKEIVVDGNKHYSRDNVLRSLPTLKIGETPRVNAISENLRAANENPGRKLTLNFKSGEKDTDLTARINVTDQKPWKITIGADNTGSGTTGDYRTSVAFQHFNLFNRDHVMAMQYVTSPDHLDKVQIFSGSYRLPLYGWGDTIDLFGAYSDVDSGTTQVSGTNITVSGKGVVSGVRYNMNLPRSGEYEQKLIGGMDYRLYDNKAKRQDVEEDILPDVVAHPLNLTYSGTLTKEQLTFEGSIGLLYNIPWGDKGEQKDFEQARAGAAADYLIARYALSAMLRPGADWLVRLSGTGQYTDNRLIQGEQFGMGGSTSIRGYQEREESWDNGISGTAELYSPDFAKLAGISKTQLRLVGFYDTGYGYNQRPSSGELDNHSLGGTGAGVRLGYGEYLNFSLDWGYALNNSSTTKRGNDRIHFRMALTY